MYIEDSEFKPETSYGIPTPNKRQGIRLAEEIRARLFEVLEDLDTDPEDYLPRFEAFAATLGGAWAEVITSQAQRELAKVRVKRKRAGRFTRQFGDEEIRQAFGEGLTIDHYRQRIFRVAMGLPAEENRWYTRFNDDDNPLLQEAREYAQDYAEEHNTVQAKDPEDLPMPYSEEVTRYKDEYLDTKQRRRRNLSHARNEFTNAVYKVHENVRIADHLFADRFRLMWQLVDTRAEYERLAEKLTKPLEDYAHWYVSRYRHDAVEYKHKGAEAAWQAQKRVRDLEIVLETTEERIANPGWSIAKLAKAAENALGVYLVILEKVNQDLSEKEQAEKAGWKRRQEKLDEMIKLAKKPIRVPAVVTGEATWIDHRVLLENLTGRSNVIKTFGHAYIYILDTVIDVGFLRQWLTLVCQNPATGKRVPKSKWDQWQWTSIQVTEVDTKHAIKPVKALIFILQAGSIRLTTTLYDLKDVYDSAVLSGQQPVLNLVELEEQPAEIPAHRGVWTTEDINKYQPAITPV